MINKLRFIRTPITISMLTVLFFSTQVVLANISNGPENPRPIVFRTETDMASMFLTMRQD